MQVEVGPSGRVRASYSIELPTSVHNSWKTLADFRRIVCLDHFHSSVDLHAPEPGAGVEFDLPHRALGLLFERRGKILQWTEGRGYAFSDLSAHDPLRAFPHVFVLCVEPRPSSRRRAAVATATGLRLEVRGRWTGRWMPRWAVRLWIAWNVWSMGTSVANAVLTQALRDRRRRAGPARR